MSDSYQLLTTFRDSLRGPHGWRPTATLPPRRWLVLSLLATLLVGSCTFLVTIKLSRAGTLVKTDGLAYFLYARSAVIDFDTDISNEFETLDARLPPDAENEDNMMVALRKHGKRHPETGRIVVPWPVGSGLVMVPFYAVGWAVEWTTAQLTGRSADSYGLVTQFFYGFGSLFYGWMGFWATMACCRRALRHAVPTSLRDGLNPWLATLGLIFAGSPVFYIFISPSMSHATSFGFLAVLVLLWWQRWDGEAEGIAILGFLLGLLMTVRYQNTMFCPLLVALVLRRAWQESWRAAVRDAGVGIAALLLPVTVQVLHYLTQHGTSGYGTGLGGGSVKLEQNEVSLLSHHFFDVLFSCLHGLVYWTPLAGLAIVALIWAALKHGWARVFLGTFLLHVYLIGALADGTAGHAFGMRYLIESTPLLASGLALWLAHQRRNAWGAKLWIAVFAVLVLINGLLILAFGVGTISGTDCVTHGDMVRGIGAAFGRLLPAG